MAIIHVLDSQTIDKIAAGEVVERPASVVKELVENAIDSGADSITVEIKDGGISMIRVTDNGSGIQKDQIRYAFLRHATSKIQTADDLTELVSLGFRGEALASIAAVSMVELITKPSEDLTGVRYAIEGGIEKDYEEIGAPDGTTIIVRNLFYNTPPRKKFLKQPQSEGNAVNDLMEHLAMSHPDISFKFVSNNQTKLHTNGNGNLKDILYRIYGKDISDELIDFTYQESGIHISGYLGKPIINRSNRNFEIFFINNRYIKSTLLSSAVEEGYREYLMQHKFPFCVLHFTIDTARIDVNVHPTKMEVRISDSEHFRSIIQDAVFGVLHHKEMIPEVKLTEETESKPSFKESIPEPFENIRKKTFSESADLFFSDESTASETSFNLVSNEISGVLSGSLSAAVTEPVISQPSLQSVSKSFSSDEIKSEKPQSAPVDSSCNIQDSTSAESVKETQLNMFEEKLLSETSRREYRIIGQIFDTYWLIVYQDKLMIVDQHAAHEKVKYERLMHNFNTNSIVSQAVMPPIIVTLSGKERECYQNHQDAFLSLGFEIEEFGGNDYSIRSIPMDLYGYSVEELFYDMIDELSDDNLTGTPESIRIKIATMACKSAVKGNSSMTQSEMEALLDELLLLDNPYNCPHGRPTIVSMSKYELEKKFKRIVT